MNYRAYNSVFDYMRQLRDERFYRKPEYKDLPRGSRWTEASGWVTGGADPYTQERGE